MKCGTVDVAENFNLEYLKTEFIILLTKSYLYL